jgi:nucleotide-binding universal stress UspA family protein
LGHRRLRGRGPGDRAAVDLSNRTGSELHAVHVWHDMPSPYAHAFVKRELRRQGQEILVEQVKRIEDSGGTVAGSHLREGRASDEVIELSEELEAGLLIVGSRGLGTVKRILMGSHSEEIVHHAHIPVLVIRHGAVWPPTRIIIGDDFSEDAKKAAELAVSIGGVYESRALLLHIHPELRRISPEGRTLAVEEFYDAVERDKKRLRRRAGELADILGSSPEIRVTEGHAAASILEVARQGEEPPLIAVGSRGIAGIRRTRLGSVSTKVVTAAEGPVLVCPRAE